MNYSWIYSTTHKTQPIKKINGAYQFVNNDKDNTRLLGSRDSILTDLLYTSENEKKLRSSQLIHDILIYQILSNYLN
jgi:asparagine synthetase B (glutamine-hydrolysing)